MVTRALPAQITGQVHAAKQQAGMIASHKSFGCLAGNALVSIQFLCAFKASLIHLYNK